MTTTTAIRRALTGLADPERAKQMAAYQRDQFPFLGIAAVPRRQATRALLHVRPTDFAFARELFAQPEREFHYCACDHVRFGRLTTSDLPELKNLVQTKSWWDTVDSLAKAVGAASDSATMLQWARDDDFWVRRVAIIHQLGFRERTDTQVLSEIIRANLGSAEFFINKAIGWALRDYSKSDPQWVRRFVDTHALETLSVREATKYI